MRARSLRSAGPGVRHATDRAAASPTPVDGPGVQHRRRPTGLQHPAGRHARPAVPHPASLERPELRRELRAGPSERYLCQRELRAGRRQWPELLAAAGGPRAAARHLPAAAGSDGELQ